MDIKLLTGIGLTESQANTYLALIEAGSLTPPQLAQRNKENRTAAYMALAKLEDLGLATVELDISPKTYKPASPSALQNLLNKRKQELDAVDKTYRDSLSELLSYYFDKQAKPGIRFFSGLDGLKEIWKDHHETGEHLLVVRTTADEEFGSFLYESLDKSLLSKEVLGPDWPEAVEWAEANNKRHHRTSHWMPKEYYTAPVEFCVYGNKVSMISFGKEAVGIIIESQQIAEGMKQLYKLAKIGGDSLMRRRNI